jgi:hypothetical protein
LGHKKSFNQRQKDERNAPTVDGVLAIMAKRALSHKLPGLAA